MGARIYAMSLAITEAPHRRRRIATVGPRRLMSPRRDISWKIERLRRGLGRARRPFGLGRFHRSGEIAGQRCIAAQDLLPRELVAFAVSLFRNLQTARRKGHGVLLTVNVDFALQVFLKLGRHDGGDPSRMRVEGPYPNGARFRACFSEPWRGASSP